MNPFKLLLLASATLALVACSNLEHPTHTFPSGLGSKKQPIRCNGESGAESYLNRLKSKSGERVSYYYVGNFGKGPDGHLLDGYAVQVGTEAQPILVLMDKSHPRHRERRALRGFKLAPATAR